MAIAIRKNEKVVVLYYSNAVHVSVDTLRQFVGDLPEDEAACVEYLHGLEQAEFAALAEAIEEHVERGGDTWDCSTASHKNWTDGTLLSFSAAPGRHPDFVLDQDDDVDDLKSTARALVKRIAKGEIVTRVHVPDGWIGFTVGKPGAPRVACAARKANFTRYVLVRKSGAVERDSTVSDETAAEVLPVLLKRMARN